MGHLFKYRACCQTTARPRTCLVQTSLILFTFRNVHSSRSCSHRDVNFCHVWWSLLSNLQWSPSFFRTLWELVAMTFRNGRSASIRTAMAVCSSPRPANWTPSWRNSSSKLAINQVCQQIKQSICPSIWNLMFECFENATPVFAGFENQSSMYS